MLWGPNPESQITARSCKWRSHSGKSLANGIRVIHTPEFRSAEDIKNHINHQMRAIAKTAIYGIYVTVKLGRVEEMAEILRKIMDSVGDDVRIIITFVENALQETGCDINHTKQRLSQLLDVGLDNIFAVGKDTSADDVEAFVKSTLHQPKLFQVSKEQHASMSSQTLDASMYQQYHNEVRTKADGAKQACPIRSQGSNRGQTNMIIQAINKKSGVMELEAKTDAFEDSKELQAYTSSSTLETRNEEIKIKDNAAKQASQILLREPGCSHTNRSYEAINKTDILKVSKEYMSSPMSRASKYHQDLVEINTTGNAAKQAPQMLIYEPRNDQTMNSQVVLPTIVFFGKVGHGKTRITNLLCGTKYASQMTAQSCTRQLQFGKSLRNGIHVIDTPGFYSAEDIKNHIDQQKRAIEHTAISGVYAVVKYGRVDEMAEILNKIMDFVGEDDVRIFITFVDNALLETGCDIEQAKERLSRLLEVRRSNIFAVGINTNADDVETFLESTLHKPKYFQVSKEQHAYMSSQTSGARKYHQDLEEISTKVDAAEHACQILLQKPSCGQINKIIEATHKKTKMMMEEAKTDILHDAEELPLEEQAILRSKLMSLTVRSEERFRKFTQDQYPFRCYMSPFVQVEFIQVNSTWCIQYVMNSTAMTPMELRKKLHEDLLNQVAQEDLLNQNSRGKKRGQQSVDYPYFAGEQRKQKNNSSTCSKRKNPFSFSKRSSPGDQQECSQKRTFSEETASLIAMERGLGPDECLCRRSTNTTSLPVQNRDEICCFEMFMQCNIM